jgi:uncharacterized damage-inducible protein DinB
MNRNRQFLFFTCVLFNLGLSSVDTAQEKPKENPKLYRLIPPPTPTSGFRAEFLEELSYYEQRYTELAEAIPAEKYTWRPAEGVRSIGEVVAHTAVANVLIQRSLEGPLKPGVTYGFSSDRIMKSTMAISGDKPKVLQELKNSFRTLRDQIVLLNDADADKLQKMFGRDNTVRGSFLAITGHLGEHLGQLIAYARMNGVVPPWTEKSQDTKSADEPKS